MKKTVYICILSLLISLFTPYMPSVSAASEGDSDFLIALGICDESIKSAEYITRGRFAEYIMNIYYGGSRKASQEEAVEFVLDNGYINNTSNESFEPDINIRNDVAAKAAVDILGYSFNVKNAEDYWTQAGILRLVSGMTPSDYLTGGDCVRLLTRLLNADAYVFAGLSGEDIKLEKKEAAKAFFDLDIIKGTVTKVEDRSVISGSSAGKSCVKIGGQIYEYEYDMSTFLGMSVKAYVRDKDDIIVYAVDDSYKTVTVTDNMIDRDSSTESELVVYNEKKKIKYKFETDVDVVINGSGYFEYKASDLMPYYGSVTLIDNDGNGRYDVVRVVSYKTAAVNYIETSEKTIGDFYGNDIEKLSECDSLIVTRDGKQAYFSEIMQDDVVGAAIDRNGNHAELFVTSEKVSGVVNALNGDEITVNGDIYEIAPFYKNISEDKKTSVSVGDNIMATLDMFGRIAHIRQISNGVLKYGYMINAYVTDHGDNEMKIFTSSGDMVTLSVKDNAKINGNVKFSEDSVKLLFANGGTKVSPQLIKYSVNSDNEVIRIYSQDSDKLSCDFGFEKRSESYGQRVLSDNGDFIYNTATVIFSVPDPNIESDDNDYAIVKNVLSSSSAYNYTEIAAYDVDSFGIARAVVSRTSANLDAKIDADIKRDTEILIISDIITCVSDDDEVMKKICGYDKNSRQEYYIRENKYSLLQGLEPGDAIICLRDYVTDYVVDILVVNKASSEDYFIAKDKLTSTKIPFYEVLRGKVANRLGSILRVASVKNPLKESDYKMYSATGATVFIVENGKVRYGNLGEIQIDDEILIRARASVVWEVIVYR